MSAAVVLMAYGSPSLPEDIRPYFEDIRGGRPVSDHAVEELTERYRRIGGRSPLDDVTGAQRTALERALGLPVFVGMKHWQPRIAEAAHRAVAAGRADRPVAAGPPRPGGGAGSPRGACSRCRPAWRRPRRRPGRAGRRARA